MAEYFDQEAISKCTICTEPIRNITTLGTLFNTSIKCDECLKKMNTVPSGLPFKAVNENDKSYECPICLSIIKDATELSCTHLMCKQCLE